MKNAEYEPCDRSRILSCNNEHIGIVWTHPGVCPLCASHEEMDTTTFQSLHACRDKYGLSNWMFEIEALGVSADGAGGVYSILPEEKMEAVDLSRHASRPLFQWQEQDDA